MRLLVFILCIVSADAAFLCTVSADAAFPDEKIDKNAVIFAAADVPKSTKELVKSWYSIGVDAWGSYGPIEIYVVGNRLDAAAPMSTNSLLISGLRLWRASLKMMMVAELW